MSTIKGTILYIGNFELPDKGASANRVMTHAKLFRALGYNTVYLGVSHEKQINGIEKLAENLYERQYPSSTLQWLKHGYGLTDILSVIEHCENLRYIVLYNAQYSITCRLRKWCKKNCVKLIYDCTEWNPSTEGNILKKYYKELDTQFIKKKLGKKVDGIIAVSTRMLQNYERQVPAILVPPLVDTEDAIWHQPTDSVKEGFEFCYAGAPYEKDNTGLLVEAFSQIESKTARLHIIGLTKEEFVRMYPDQNDVVRELNDRLVFTGWIDHSRTIKYLLNTDCFIFLRENTLRNHVGFPTKFVEAYTSGVDIIATDISDLAKYSGVGVHIMRELNSSVVIKTMNEVLANHCGRKNLQTAFDWRNYVKGMAEFLD